MAKSDIDPLEFNPPVNPFRRVVLRGLAVLLPPLLTIVIFVWIGNTVVVYLLEPLESGANWVLYQGIVDVRSDLPLDDPQGGTSLVDNVVYKQVADDKFVPKSVYDAVRAGRGSTAMPDTAEAIYQRYVQITYLKRHIVVPVFLSLFTLLLYLLGKFLAAGMGRFFWQQFERIIHRLPIVRNVYSSVKQVTDFMFSEREIEYTRVIAVEYPRKGIWSLGMVTGESLLDISSAANEAVMSVLIPTSPAPFTGFTVTIKKSEAVDLNLTIDQAFQFIVSCGVVVPSHQMRRLLADDADGDTILPSGGNGSAVSAS
jgi:uncharacterized membrane protein